MQVMPSRVGSMAAPAAPAGFDVPWNTLGLSAVALLLGGAVALRLRRRAAPEAAAGGITDVLGAVLHRAQAPESGGVRWDVAIYPERLSVPGYAILTALLQNAYDEPRAVTLEIAPGPLFPEGFSAGAALNGGEAGILRIPVFVSRSLPSAEYLVRAALSARAPRGEGRRLLGAPSGRPRASRSAALRVVSSHDRPPVNLFAYDWKGFTSLYAPPQTAPDLTEMEILQELPSRPADGG